MEVYGIPHCVRLSRALACIPFGAPNL